MEMTQKEFDKWAVGCMYKVNKNLRYNVVRTYDNNGIIIIDLKTGHTGISRCHPEDNFDYKIGFAIAYARLKGLEVPTVKEKNIEKEIEDFIFDIMPVSSLNLLIKDKNGIEEYANDSMHIKILVKRILNDIIRFAKHNVANECSTVEGMWNYCKKTEGFGDICHLYYEDDNGNFINFGYGYDDDEEEE